jgi:hypothetical protein
MAADVSSLGAEGSGPDAGADLKAEPEERGDSPEGSGGEPLKVRGVNVPWPRSGRLQGWCWERRAYTWSAWVLQAACEAASCCVGP